MAANEVQGLDDACGVCGKRAGGHTLDEWATCLGSTPEGLAFAPLKGDDTTEQQVTDNLRQRFNLDPDTIIADTIKVYAVTLDGNTGPVNVFMPGVFHEFQISKPGVGPVTVAKVAFIGTDETMRGYGRLVRDSANGAANAAARKQAGRGR